jgi:predicted secreted protein
LKKGGVEMGNNILAKLYCDEKKLLDINIDHLNEYMFALKNSDSISVNRKDYKLKKIKLIHGTEGNMVITLQVELKEVSEPGIRVLK